MLISKWCLFFFLLVKGSGQNSNHMDQFSLRRCWPNWYFMHYIAYSSSTCSAMVARVSPFYSKHNIIFPLVPKGATISWVLEKGMSAALGGRDNMCFSTHTMPPLLELLGLGLRFWSSIFVPHLNHLGIFPEAWLAFAVTTMITRTTCQYRHWYLSSFYPFFFPAWNGLKH